MRGQANAKKGLAIAAVIVLLIAAGVLYFLLDSDGGGDEKITAIPVFRATSVADEAPARVEVNVFFDATISMQGYTTIAANNVYRRLPDRLEDIGNNMGGVRFFAFGENFRELKGREHRAFSSPDAYVELVTAINNVVQAANTKNLTVIISDLFEDSADWSKISQVIRDRFMVNRLSVAIIGIKNPFDGEIFDVGLDKKKFRYNSGTDKAKYRPFYMLVLGHDRHVSEFLRRWRDIKSPNNQTEYFFLSHQGLSRQADFSNLTIERSVNIFPDAKLGLTEKSMKEFGVAEENNRAELVTSFNYLPDDGGCSVDPSRLKLAVKTMALEGDEWKEYELAQKPQFSLQSEGDGKYSLSLSFTESQALKRGKVNLIFAAIEPEYGSLRLPRWVKDWTLVGEDAMAASELDGSRTANLRSLMESLKNAAFETT